MLHILPIAGFYTFLPKYLETQFGLTVYDAAMVSGMTFKFYFLRHKIEVSKT